MSPSEPGKSTPNEPGAWNAIWDRDRVQVLEPRTVSQIMDEIKFEYLRPHLPSEGMIVEFGCGSARLLRFAASRGLTPIGIDFSHRALEVARQASGLTASVTPLLIQGDVRRTPFPAECVDVVGSTGLLEHFDHPEEVINEMVRVLRPGGLFYSDIVPKKFSLYRSLSWLKRREKMIFERAMSRREIEGFLMNAGLSEVQVFAAGVFPPMLPVIERSPVVRELIGSIVSATLSLWRAADATPIGDLLGFYYFAIGRKPAAGPSTV